MAEFMPPPQYDVPPAIQVIEQVWTYDRVNAKCQSLPVLTRVDFTYVGCNYRDIVNGKVVCYVWRIDDATVARHERAHCNGWKHE